MIQYGDILFLIVIFQFPFLKENFLEGIPPRLGNNTMSNASGNILKHSVSQQVALRGTLGIVVRMQQKHCKFRKLSNFLAI